MENLQLYVKKTAEELAQQLLKKLESELTVTAEYLNTKDSAKYLGMSTQALEIWRCYGGGPKFTKLSKAVRYKKSDLDAFMASHSRNNTAEGGQNV